MDKYELQQFAARLNAKIANARELLNQAAEEASHFAKAVAAIPEGLNEEQPVGAPAKLGAVELNESLFAGLGVKPLEKIHDAAEEAAIGRREALARAGTDKAALADAAVGELISAIEDKAPRLAASLRQREAAQSEDSGMPRLAHAAKIATTEPAVTSNEEAMREGWLQRFYGATSIIYKYFGEKSLPNGRGAIVPTETNLYDADLTNIALTTLMKWPEGFYRNKATSGLQYLLKTPSVLLTIDFHEYVSGGEEALVIHYSPRVNDVLRVIPKKLALKDIQAVLPLFEKELLRQSMAAQNAV